MKRSFETAFVIGCLAGVAHCIFDSSAASDDASDDDISASSCTSEPASKRLKQLVPDLAPGQDEISTRRSRLPSFDECFKCDNSLSRYFQDTQSQTMQALFEAIEVNNFGDLEKILLAGDVDINKQHCGQTLLEFAINEGRFDCVRWLLIQKGINPNVKSQDSGMTPLHLAVEWNNTTIVNLLLDHECIEANTKDDDGCTALFCATACSLGALLASPKVDVNAFDWERDTILHRAAKFGYPLHYILKLLQHPGIDVNRLNGDGKSPLMCCLEPSEFPSVHVFNALLEDERTIISKCDITGRTVRDHLLQLLEPKGVVITTSDDLCLAQFMVCLYQHEKKRLQQAKEQVKILLDSRESRSKHIPREVVAKHVLPFLADIVSPLELLRNYHF